MSSSSIASIFSINLFFVSYVLTVLTTSLKYNEYTADKGKNITINCQGKNPVMWIKKNEVENNSIIVQLGALLILTNLKESDAGIYACVAMQNRTKDVDNVTDEDDDVYVQSKLVVRTSPGPVTQLYFKASTVLGFLIWRWNKNNSGGYPIRSFTAEYRSLSKIRNTSNSWIRLDPINISPNVRQMEVYKLVTNSTYEFRIWANNRFGAGVIVSTQATTLPDTKEEDLVRLIQDDIENFDVRIWITAVGIVVGSFVMLTLGVCALMAVECYQTSVFANWENSELLPNIVLNPGFCNLDGLPVPFINTKIPEDDEYSTDSDTASSMEKPIEVFKRKVSVFFTGQSIRRM